jgi:prevent-host-death family protein
MREARREADLCWLSSHTEHAAIDLDHCLVHTWKKGLPTGSEGYAMRISVTEAKGQLTDLVRRAEAGDEIILTRHGQAAVRLVPVKKARLDARARKELLEAVRASGSAKASPGPGAARSQDFLYDENGLPG